MVKFNRRVLIQVYHLTPEERSDKRRSSRAVMEMAKVNLKEIKCTRTQYLAHKKRKMDRKIKVCWLNMNFTNM